MAIVVVFQFVYFKFNLFSCRREIALSGTEAEEMTNLSSESFSPVNEIQRRLQVTASIRVERGWLFSMP